MLIQLETQCSKPKPRTVFYSYSHKDEELRNELDKHLKLLKQDGFISTWYDRKIRPGDEWDHIINDNLNTADVILFLVSHNFLVSKYCQDIEVKRAMARSQNQEAILIPIIIKPCAWTSQEFAKLQVLPKNCKPLEEWPDSGFAHVAEELRIMLIRMNYPQKPTEALEGQHGNWFMKLRSRPNDDSKIRGQKVVNKLREYTEDFTINLLAISNTQIIDGATQHIGLILILNGTPEAFNILEKAHRDGRLSNEIDEDLISFYVYIGATIQGSSNVGDLRDIKSVECKNLLLGQGRKYRPSIIKTLFLPKEDLDSVNFIIYRGEENLNESEKQINYQQLYDHFSTCLAIKDELQWVNLSVYEADRMLPKELSGSELGRILLEQDCMLKRLTASFMHPDSQIGREFWDAVYVRSRQIFGTSKIPFNSFQKVWVVPTKASIYEADTDSLEPGSFNAPPNHTMLYIVDNILDVYCEEDMVALSYNLNSNKDYGLNNKNKSDFVVEIFKQIVLPKLKQEVNEGEHFADARRIYSAMLCATWVKRNLHLIKNRKILQYIDTGNYNALKGLIYRISPSNGSWLRSQCEVEKMSKNNSCISEHKIPNAAAFEIPENVEFFNQYLRLFKNGVFRCARNEIGDLQDERVIRVYFSGAIDFRNMSNIIKITDQKF